MENWKILKCCNFHKYFISVETQGRRHQKSKTVVSVAPQKGHVSSKNLKKKKKKFISEIEAKYYR